MILLETGTYVINYSYAVAVFAEIFGFSNIFGFLTSGKLGPKMNQNCKIRCVSFEPKFKILKDFSNTVFVLFETGLDLLWSKFQQDQTIFGAVKAQKITKRGHFMDAKLIQKTLKIFNFTTTYAILIKLTTDIYLKKVFHLGKSWGLSHSV